MKAVITGAAGFVGRHMTRELGGRGWSLRRVDTAWGEDAVDFFRTDNTHHALVVHCAAAEPHRAAIDGKPMHLAANLELDAAMFRWAVRTGTRVLYLSSSAAYPADLQDGEDDERRLHETDIGWPRWTTAIHEAENIGLPDAAYGWTKLTGERMAQAAAETGLPVHVVRPFSGYGEDQGESWPFGAFVARARRREDPFVVWGNGSQVRDWIHISDVVAGALAVVDADERRPVNLCTGVGTSMAELVRLMCRRVGYDPEIELRTDKPAGVAYRVGDPGRLLEHYTPKVGLADGVRLALP